MVADIFFFVSHWTLDTGVGFGITEPCVCFLASYV